MSKKPKHEWHDLPQPGWSWCWVWDTYWNRPELWRYLDRPPHAWATRAGNILTSDLKIRPGRFYACADADIPEPPG